MIKVIARKLVQEGKAEKVIKLYEELVAASRKEEGCIKYELYQAEKDALSLAVVEAWESKDALNKHKNSEHFIRIVPMIGEFISKSEVNIYIKLF